MTSEQNLICGQIRESCQYNRRILSGNFFDNTTLILINYLGLEYFRSFSIMPIPLLFPFTLVSIISIGLLSGQLTARLGYCPVG